MHSRLAEVKRRWVLVLLVMEALMPGSRPAAGQAASDALPSLKVGTASATRGQKVTGVIAVPAGQDPATNIAVAVVHGARPGQVLAIVAGAHGTEYSSILAVERLIQLLDPGGVIPKQDVAKLKEMGIKGIFPGGTSFSEMVAGIRAVAA